MNILGLLTGIGLLIGVGGNTVHQMERHASNDIRTLLRSPNAKVRTRLMIDGPINGPFGVLQSVQVFAQDFTISALPLFVEPWRAKDGWIKSLDITFSNFSLAGLRVESLHAQIPDCRYDFGFARKTRSVRLSKSGTGRGTIVVKIADMEAYALHKFREIKSISLEFFGSRVLAKGRATLLMKEYGFEILSGYAVQGKRQLVLVQPKIWMDGRRATPAIAAAVTKLLTPVLHLDRDLKLFGAFDIESIQFNGDRVIISGPMRIPAFPVFYANAGSSQSACESPFLALLATTGSSASASASQLPVRR